MEPLGGGKGRGKKCSEHSRIGVVSEGIADLSKGPRGGQPLAQGHRTS